VWGREAARKQRLAVEDVNVEAIDEGLGSGDAE
jgi:hypothetical protein